MEHIDFFSAKICEFCGKQFYEKRQKAKFTDQDLPNLRKAVYVAKKVGKGLDESEIL